MRPLRAAATALVAVLALSSCDGGSDPADPISTSPQSGTIDAPSTASPTDAATTAPKDETAQQFIRRWVDLINRAQRTGDVAAYRAISGPDCRSCKQFADRVEAVYANGGYIQSGGTTITGIKRDGTNQWTVSLNAEPTEVKQTSDAEVEHLKGGPYSYVAYLTLGADGWILVSYLGTSS